MRALAITLILLLFFACTRQVNLDVQFEPKTVLVGNIEVGKPAIINLYETLSVTDTRAYPPITNAGVFIKNEDGEKEQLIENDPGIYKGESILGDNKEYEIEVNIENKIFRGETKMPLDNLEVTLLDYQILSEDPNGSLLLDFETAIEKKIQAPVYERVRFYYNNFFLDEFQYFSNNEEQPDKIQTNIPLAITWRSGDSLVMEIIQMEAWLSDYYLQARNIDDVNSISVASISPITDLDNNFDGDLLGYFAAIRRDTFKVYID